MEKSLDTKLQRIAQNPGSCRDFILADARDADMAWGVPSFGVYPDANGVLRPRTRDAFMQEIRDIVEQGFIDICLMSASVGDALAHGEELFEDSSVTPAIRANDTTDIWLPRGATYNKQPSLPFRSASIAHAQFGSLANAALNDLIESGEVEFEDDLEGEMDLAPVINLGLYSITFNNNLETDYRALEAYAQFRAEAEEAEFKHFFEVFAPNVDSGIPAEQIPDYVNDCICRTLAGVARSARPVFLKIPYFGPRAMEELVNYDSSMVVGILGGSSGTTYDAFNLVHEAKKYGARVALFGRKIKNSDHPLSFVEYLRAVADDVLAPKEAVKAYHDALAKRGIKPSRSLADDLVITDTALSYSG